MTLESLKDLYVEQLRDLYSAEKQLIDALPNVRDNASHDELREAFESHLEETREHARRLEQIFEGLDENPQGETCEAMQGLVKEADEILSKDADDDVLDAGIIAGAQRVEHYEISGYGTVATYAEMLGRNDDYQLLSKTLNEEKEADEKLNRIAKNVVNPEAAHA